MSASAIRAVIFDRDGVLTWFDQPSISAYLAARLPLGLGEVVRRWQQYGSAAGFPRTEAEETAFFAAFWDAIAQELQLTPAIRAELQALDYTRFVQPFPDARPALEAARAAGLRTGVLSNFSLASLDRSLEAAGLRDLIDAACAATVIGASKPDPRAYEIAAERLGVPPAACLFVDDETPCVAGAEAVGMRAYLLQRDGPADDPGPGVLRSLTELQSIWRP